MSGFFIKLKYHIISSCLYLHKIFNQSSECSWWFCVFPLRKFCNDIFSLSRRALNWIEFKSFFFSHYDKNVLWYYIFPLSEGIMSNFQYHLFISTGIQKLVLFLLPGSTDWWPLSSLFLSLSTVLSNKYRERFNMCYCNMLWYFHLTRLFYNRACYCIVDAFLDLFPWSSVSFHAYSHDIISYYNCCKLESSIHRH